MSRIYRFDVKDEDGSIYHLKRIRNFIDGSDLNGKETIEIDPDYRTDDGRKVNRISKGHYKIIGLPDIHVFSNDPNAP